MTHDPVQSDLDLANRLLKANRSEQEIIAALTVRGVDHAKATQLVADLQSGKTIALEIPFGSEFGELCPSEDVIYPATAPRYEPAPTGRRHRQRSFRSRRRRLLLLLGLAVALGGLALGYYFYSARAGAQPGRAPSSELPQPSSPAG